MANAVRFLAVDAVEKAKSGHPGMPMGMADVATVLFSHFLKFDAADPAWPDRDRFVLSAGHGSMLLYALLYLAGYPQICLDELKPSASGAPGRRGIPNMAIHRAWRQPPGRLDRALRRPWAWRWQSDLPSPLRRRVVDHYTYVIAGDGCLMEGISHEAISLAGHLKLSRLIVLFDDNAITIDGIHRARHARTISSPASWLPAGRHAVSMAMTLKPWRSPSRRNATPTSPR